MLAIRRYRRHRDDGMHYICFFNKALLNTTNDSLFDYFFHKRSYCFSSYSEWKEISLLEDNGLVEQFVLEHVLQFLCIKILSQCKVNWSQSSLRTVMCSCMVSLPPLPDYQVLSLHSFDKYLETFFRQQST